MTRGLETVATGVAATVVVVVVVVVAAAAAAVFVDVFMVMAT